MKSLIITRHAKSSWDSGVSSDFKRPLNKRGKNDAPMMADRLRTRGPKPELILSSTATRAIDTAQLLMPVLEISTQHMLTTDSIYEAPRVALEKAIGGLPDSCSVAMLVGHNPGVSSLCSFLDSRASLQMPTCAMACFELNIEQWAETYQDCATLVWYDYPKNDAHQ